MALEAIEEEQTDRFRLQAFAVWFDHGKKGQTFGAFLKTVGLGYGQVKAADKKPSKERIDEIYAQAAAVRKLDLRGRNGV